MELNIFPDGDFPNILTVIGFPSRGHFRHHVEIFVNPCQLVVGIFGPDFNTVIRMFCIRSAFVLGVFVAAGIDQLPAFLRGGRLAKRRQQQVTE